MASKDASICAKAGSLCGNSAFSGKALWQSSVYEFESLQEMNTARYVYGRYGSPNSDELAMAVARLEGAQQGLATSSGMGALVAAILSIGKAGDHLLAQFDCYGGSREFFQNDAPRFGFANEVASFGFNYGGNSVVKRAQAGVVLGWVTSREVPVLHLFNGNNNNNKSIIVFIESVSNPCVRVADIQSISTVCKKYGAFLIADNTFPTPLRIKPLKQGADMVIHSVTKFLGGHSDMVAGVVAGSSHHIELASKLARHWGLLASPFDSWLATKGITTLQVRMDRALSTTAELARRILCSSMHRKLYWTPDCAIMSIEVPGGLDGASRAISNLKMIKFVPSLGGTTTTVSHPVSTSESSIPRSQREAMGITDGLLRFSVGLEDVDDIWIDLERSLLAAAAIN